jgi:hypothetical protein
MSGDGRHVTDLIGGVDEKFDPLCPGDMNPLPNRSSWHLDACVAIHN